ncbi:hypothetical protein NY671_21555, partial [Xanthomonas hortorum pv. pelargonii]|uniref:hypothetical protein n=1 Tax=Xanthomonas hortorum TaxID=56454 RepID=UPI00235868E0
AFSVAERQLHGLLLNMRRVVSRIYGALFRGSLVLDWPYPPIAQLMRRLLQITLREQLTQPLIVVAQQHISELREEVQVMLRVSRELLRMQMAALRLILAVWGNFA